MELTFRNALLAAGGFLFLAGIMSEAAYLAYMVGSEGIAEQFSVGVNTVIFTFFSGVLIGVGVALAADSAIVRLKKCKARAAFLSLLLMSCLCIAAVSFFAGGENQSVFMLIFFASISAFLAFFASLLVILVSYFGASIISCEPSENQLPPSRPAWQLAYPLSPGKAPRPGKRVAI